MHRPKSLFRWTLLSLLLGTPSVGWADEAAASAIAAAIVVDTTASPEPNVKEEQGKRQPVTLHEGRLRFTLPAAWKQVKPRNKLIEVELAIPSLRKQKDRNSREKPVPGRMTMMASGGEVETIFRRWVSQFRLGQDAGGKDGMQRDVHERGQATVHAIDIAGTYFDAPKGPLGPKVEHPNYRMLGAIVEVEQAGRYFIKIVGPEALIAELAETFWEVLSSLEVLEPDEERATNEPGDSSPAAP